MHIAKLLYGYADTPDLLNHFGSTSPLSLI